MASAEIHSIRTVSGNQPVINRKPEEKLMTFLAGVPVSLNGTDGGIQEWNGSTVANGIAGFCKVAASNLANTGVAQQITFGTVPNQPAAVNIARPPFNDGKIDVESAAPDTVFFAQIGPAQSISTVFAGQSYGMTKDTDNHWFVDTSKTGANAVCQIVDLDPVDTVRGVHIVIVPASSQLLA